MLRVAACSLKSPASVSVGDEQGAFLLNLKENDAARYAEFIEDPNQRVEWGEAPRGEPMHRRLEHFIQTIAKSAESA